MQIVMYRPPHNILAVNQHFNPSTGDPNAGMMWIILGALIISAILIVVLTVTGKKRK